MIHIVFIITGLGIGGAEAMLYKLLSSIDHSSFKCRVISLTSQADYGPRIQHLGIPVDTLNLDKPAYLLHGIFRFVRILKENKHALVSTWMYHADLLGGLIARMLNIKCIVWNIRNATLIGRGRLGLTPVIVKSCAILSKKIPRAIITNSSVARDIHVGLGYAAEKFSIIPNGFDLDRFKPDLASRVKVRKALEIAPDVLLIGKFARLDPQKNHRGFLQAFAEVSREIPNVKALLVGTDVDATGTEIDEEIERLKLKDHVIRLPAQSNIEDYYAALDVFCLASIGEAFPNVVGEAMATALCCVVSDAGDCRSIVGDAGIVVESGSVQALAQGLKKALLLSHAERESFGMLARSRIQSHYTITAVAKAYEKLFAEIKGEDISCVA